MAKRFHFFFTFNHDGQWHKIQIEAESVREAKAVAESLCAGLHYTNDYEEITEDVNPFDEQKIAWICAKPADELPFPFKQLKKAALLFAYGTDCQCCLGYRIMAGLVVGGVIGYFLG